MIEALNVDKANVVELSETNEWYAWVNLMPPPPNDFHVVGSVLVSNPGVQAILTPKVPQGINPTILVLELVLIQQPGVWPQIQTWVQARYDKVVLNSPYKSVQIFSENGAISEIPVEEVH